MSAGKRAFGAVQEKVNHQAPPMGKTNGDTNCRSVLIHSNPRLSQRKALWTFIPQPCPWPYSASLPFLLLCRHAHLSSHCRRLINIFSLGSFAYALIQHHDLTRSRPFLAAAACPSPRSTFLRLRSPDVAKIHPVSQLHIPKGDRLTGRPFWPEHLRGSRQNSSRQVGAFLLLI